jgi:hypothetical protein
MMIFSFTVDHLAYLTSRKHRRLTHAYFRKISGRTGGIFACQVLHEALDECCAIEPWLVTASRISRALADDGCPALWAVIGGGVPA